MNKIFPVFLLVVLLANTNFAQNVHYVNHLATGTGTGENWINAFPKIQNALQTAQAGDAIWVAKGTYFPTADNDRTRSFQLKKGVQLLGGFAGNEVLATERNPSTHVTILSGNIGDPANNMDNSYTVVVGDQLDDSTVFDGFTVEGGYFEDGRGGGIVIWESTGNVSHPVIRNCTFRKNFAQSGGAAYIDQTQPLFEGCVFESNRSVEIAGALLKTGPSPLSDTFKLVNCTFVANRVPQGAGGAVFLENIRNSVVLLKGCTFERDSSWEGGALTSRPSLPEGYVSTVVVDSCFFRKNWAIEAGVIHYRGTFDGAGHHLNFFMLNSVIEENETQSLSSKILFDVANEAKVSIVIDRCLFQKNKTGGCMGARAEDNSELSIQVNRTRYLENAGSGVFARVWGASAFNRCTTTIDNCLFALNRGCIAVDSRAENNYVHTTVSNSTFFRNSTSGAHNVFGKVTYNNYYSNSDTFNNTMYINNCAVWEPQQEIKFILVNQNRDIPGVYYPTGKGYVIRNSSFSFAAIDTVPYYEGEFWNNTFNTYPMFVDTNAKDFRLLPCSPLVNRGMNALVPNGANIDLAGLPRIVGDTVDIGAYEQQIPCTSSDHEVIGSKNTFEMWPNPSSSGQICFTALERSHCYVYDILGQMVAQIEALNTEEPTCESLAHLPDGAYMIVYSGQKSKAVSKWVKAVGR